MKKILSTLALFLATLIIVGCGPAKLSPKEQGYIDNKETLYTQISMWEEKGRVIATNYTRGTLIPVNSKVIIEKITSSVIVMNYNGQRISIQNNKYTKVNINTLLERTFSKSKLDLSKFSIDTQESILKGEVKVGMSKSEVVITRGYPPAHKTASLKEDSWRYWVNRFSTNLYTFKDDKLKEIVK